MEHGIPQARKTPKPDDGVINIQEPFRIKAKSIINESISAQAEGARVDGRLWVQSPSGVNPTQ